MISHSATGWRVRIYRGGKQVASATFVQKRQAAAWEAEQKRAQVEGLWIDPARGKTTLAQVIAEFNAHRQGTISAHSFNTDETNLRLHLPPATLRLPIGSIEPAHLEDVFAAMLRTHARATVLRLRDALVALFRCAKARKYSSTNPAELSVVPRGSGEEVPVIRPFSASELASLIEHARTISAGYANAIEFSELTGLRWGELAELRLNYFMVSPYPVIRVQRSRSDSYSVTLTKSRRERSVPLTVRAVRFSGSRVLA